MQNIIVFFIVLTAAIYLVRRFVQNLGAKSQNQCGCGCSGCGQRFTDGVQILSKPDQGSHPPSFS